MAPKGIHFRQVPVRVGHMVIPHALKHCSTHAFFDVLERPGVANLNFEIVSLRGMCWQTLSLNDIPALDEPTCALARLPAAPWRRNGSQSSAPEHRPEPHSARTTQRARNHPRPPRPPGQPPAASMASQLALGARLSKVRCGSCAGKGFLVVNKAKQDHSSKLVNKGVTTIIESELYEDIALVPKHKCACEDPKPKRSKISSLKDKTIQYVSFRKQESAFKEFCAKPPIRGLPNVRHRLDWDGDDPECRTAKLLRKLYCMFQVWYHTVKGFHSQRHPKLPKLYATKSGKTWKSVGGHPGLYIKNRVRKRQGERCALYPKCKKRTWHFPLIKGKRVKRTRRGFFHHISKRSRPKDGRAPRADGTGPQCGLNATFNQEWFCSPECHDERHPDQKGEE